MYLNRNEWWSVWHKQALLSTLFTLLIFGNVHAEEKQTGTDIVVINVVSMTVSPNQCVAMTQGQTCYVDIDLNWQSNQVGNFCIFSSLKSDAIQCWTQSSQGSYQQELASKHNVVFSIKRQGDITTLVKREVKMAWVHKKRGKPTNWWRIF